MIAEPTEGMPADLYYFMMIRVIFCFFTLAAQIVQVRVYLRFYRLLTILEHAF